MNIDGSRRLTTLSFNFMLEYCFQRGLASTYIVSSSKLTSAPLVVALLVDAVAPVVVEDANEPDAAVPGDTLEVDKWKATVIDNVDAVI